MSFLREAMGGEKITFGGNYETRWAASEKKAVKVIINHHGKIVKALEDLSMDTSFRTEVRQTAVGLVKQLSYKNVMLISLINNWIVIRLMGNGGSGVGAKVWDR